MKRIAVVASLVASVGLVACGGSSPKPKFSIGARPASTGRLTIISPTPNEQIKGSILHVKLKLTGAHLVQKTSTNISPDAGHIHVSVDGKVKSLLAGLTYDVIDLAPGLHILTVEFVAADHGVFNPRVLLRQAFVMVQ